MTLSICIVTWNSMKFIKDCLESIFRQSIWFKEKFNIKIAINIVDNGSQDGIVDYIRKNYPQVHILRNINNLGFCKSYNQAIKMHQTDWVLVMNSDVILEKDFLENIFKVIENNKDDVASFAGKILKVETIFEDGLPKIIKTDKIDSCGLEIKKSRQVKNIGENEIDKGQFDRQKEVFGFSGACVLYRREALEDIKFKDEYFDEDFFAYQDDFDISYRLRLLGWRALFIPNAKAYHFRGAKMNTLKPWQFLKIINARRQKSKIVNYNSYKNHLFVLIKNEIGENFIRHLPYIFWFEFKKHIYILLFETATLKSLKDFFKFLSRMILKRKIIMSRRKLSAEEIRKWMK